MRGGKPNKRPVRGEEMTCVCCGRKGHLPPGCDVKPQPGTHELVFYQAGFDRQRMPNLPAGADHDRCEAYYCMGERASQIDADELDRRLRERRGARVVSAGSDNHGERLGSASRCY